MVRECRPPAREPMRSWPARRSTIATSTPDNVNSPANISPVGPPPATTTACSATGSTAPRHPCVDNDPPIPPLPFPQVLVSASDSAARPGSCRKPPGALYVESGKEWVTSLPLPFVVRCGRTSSSRSGDAPRTAMPPPAEHTWGSSLLVGVGGGRVAQGQAAASRGGGAEAVAAQHVEVR